MFKHGTVVICFILICICVAWADGVVGNDILYVPICRNGNITVPYFVDENAGEKFTGQHTQVSVCHDNAKLYVSFVCEDVYIKSDFTTCNDPLYQQDAVEFFITSPKLYPGHYLETEMSPNNVLFASWITNHNYDCTNFTGSEIPCASSGIQWKSWKDVTQHKWFANIAVPFSMFGLSGQSGGVFCSACGCM